MPLTVALAILSLAAHAQVYKWTDADGKVHYSDKAVGNGQPLTVPKPAPPDAEARTRLQQLRNQLEGSRLNREESNAEAQKQAGELQAKCGKVQGRLKDFEDHGQMVQVKDGERVYLDGGQKDALMAEMRSFLKENCE